MKKSLFALTCLVAAVAMISGCSASGAGMTAFHIGKNLNKKDSLLKIWIDGHEAKQNKLKKGISGYAPFEIKETVSTTPKFKFEFIDPEKFGRIKSAYISVYQEFEADYSGHAEFAMHSADPSDPQMAMKPGVEYDTGKPGEQFKVTDFYDKPVEGITLKPGLEYTFLFTITGDRNETVQIFFSTE